MSCKEMINPTNPITYNAINPKQNPKTHPEISQNKNNMEKENLI